MKNILRIEEFVFFVISIFFFNHLHFSWWYFPALLLVPDISMLGYLVNPKIGAYCYNFAHHKALALIIVGIGFLYKIETIQLAGIILFAHSSMDRVFGYGLKFSDSFNNTHLGFIGKKES